MRRMSAAASPQSMSEFIEAIRSGLVCGRCGRYVGSLAREHYLPPPYPVALAEIPAQDEVAALVGFEWHMLNLMRKGNFTIRHSERDGQCVSVREWARSESRDDDGEVDAAEIGP